MTENVTTPFRLFPRSFLIVQIAMFIGFLEYVISQIVLKPGYIPGDYVGANDLFSEEGPHSGWNDFQVRENLTFEG